MTWFKVDDSFYDHPKVFDAPDCAMALWLRAGNWSARNLTDGFVPAKMPARLCDDPDTAVRELVDRGLWRRAKGGYQFHDWMVYQPSREEVEKERAAAAERQRRRRARMKEEVNPDPVTPLSRRDSRVSNRGSHGVSSPAPTRPDPTRTSTSTAVGDSSSVVDVGHSDDDSKIDKRIIELIREQTGQTIEPEWATRVRRQLLDDRQVTNPLAYISSAIRGEPARYLPPPADDSSAAVLDMVRAGDVRPDVAKRGADAVRKALPKARP